MLKNICSLVSLTNDTLTLTNSNNIFKINLANRQKTQSLSPSSDCWGRLHPGLPANHYG